MKSTAIIWARSSEHYPSACMMITDMMMGVKSSRAPLAQKEKQITYK
jgi:hypothetical protein